MYDGCTVACLLGLDEWRRLPNQIGNPCPFNLHGTCDTNGQCHNEGPVELGRLGIELWQADFHHIKPEDQYYFVVAHIRNSSEPWNLASMDNPDSSAHCTTRSMPGPQAVWSQPCDTLGSYLFKDTARIFLYAYAHQDTDQYNNVLIGSTSATIFEILQSQKDETGDEVWLKLEQAQAWLWLKVHFTPKNSSA